MAFSSLRSSEEDGARLGTVVLSASSYHAARGGNAAAPKQLKEGRRWVGGEPTEIDNGLVKKCTDSSEAGKIVDLNFHYRFIHNIAGLEQVAANLRSLDLSSNNIQTIQGLSGMVRLRELKLYSCQITRIQGLDKCITLAALHLEGNYITAIEGLDNTKQLEYLNLDNNEIQRMGKGLGKLTKLKELHLCSNGLCTLDGLAGLGMLEVLRVSDNRLRQITADQVKLPKLDELVLAGNQLSSLSFLSALAAGSPLPCPCLATLNVAGNQLTAEAFKHLPTLSQLTELGLAHNQIAELPTGLVTAWPSLEIIDLSHNLLERPQQLEPLKPLIGLREMLLEGNPLSAEDQELELRAVMTGLPPIEYLDDRPVVPATLAITGPQEEEDVNRTFPTATQPRPGSSSGRPGTGGRPGTAGGRPGTAGSRPGTAEKMKEAGVQQPLMHARIKLSERRFASVEQASQWEKATITGLAAIERQLHKTEQQADKELQEMSRFLQKAEKIMAREKELQEQGLGSMVDGQQAAPAQSQAHDTGLPLESPLPSARFSALESPPPSSRAGRKLREAVVSSRGSKEELEPRAETPPEAAVLVSASAAGSRVSTAGSAGRRSRAATPSLPLSSVVATCDEEIPDVVPTERGAMDTEGEESAMEAAEVSEEECATGVSEAEDKSPSRAVPVPLRVANRAGVRRTRRVLGGYPGGGGSGRPSPTGGQGRPPRAPPAAAIR